MVETTVSGDNVSIKKKRVAPIRVSKSPYSSTAIVSIPPLCKDSTNIRADLATTMIEASDF
jgi:hypothetical protein